MFGLKKTTAVDTAIQLHGTPWTISWGGGQEWHPVDDSENVLDQLEYALDTERGPVTLRHGAEAVVVTRATYTEAAAFVYAH